MRHLRLTLVLGILILAGGCAAPIMPVHQAGFSSDWRDLGKPWPVLIGEFSGPLTPISHDAHGFVFEVGRYDPTRYRLDYERQRLTRQTGRVAARPEGDWGKVQTAANARGRTLYLSWPDGRRNVISDTLLMAEGFAQTKDLSGLAFYEATETGGRLAYLDQATGERHVWRSFRGVPHRAVLSWSGNERFLLEDFDRQLIVHDRVLGLVIGAVEGVNPAFSPSNQYLSHWRLDGRLALLDLRSGFSWPALANEPEYRLLPTVVWSPDGSRLFVQAEAIAGADQSNPPFRLYVHTPGSGSTHRYPLSMPFDLGRYSVLLQVPQPEIGRLLEAIPKLKNGPLVALGSAGYLAGQDGLVALLDLAVRFTPLQDFGDPVMDLSLDKDGQRLIVITRQPKTVKVFAWRLPAPALLGGIFPSRGDSGLGRLRLGLTTREVRGVLGQPLSMETRIDPREGKEQVQTWHYADVGVTFIRGLLARAISSAPGAASGRGIDVGMPVAEVYERYGRPDYSEDGYLSYHGEADGAEVKVAFGHDTGGKVTSILISSTSK